MECYEHKFVIELIPSIQNDKFKTKNPFTVFKLYSKSIFSLLKFAKRDNINIITTIEDSFIDRAKRQKKILTKKAYLCLN